MNASALGLAGSRVVPMASLLALSTTAVYLGAHGLADLWPDAPGPAWFYLFIPLSGGWHAVWLNAVARSRRLPWVPLAWFASAEACRRGLIATGFAGTPALWAVIIETALLSAALHLAPRKSLSEHLAQCRRACDDISAQLRLAPGLLPWLSTAMRRALRGGRAAPLPFAELAATVRDVETRLHTHLGHMVLPEQARESLLNRARDLAAHAELAALETGLALEHEAMTAAVAFRDECARLTHLSDDDRDAIAHTGQAFLLDLMTVTGNGASAHQRSLR